MTDGSATNGERDTLFDYGFRTRRANFRAWLSLQIKHYGERLSWWLWPT